MKPFVWLFTFLILFMLPGCSDSGSGGSNTVGDETNNITISVITTDDKNEYEFGDNVVITTIVEGISNADLSIEFYVNGILAHTDNTVPFEYRLSNLFYKAGIVEIDVVVETGGVIVGGKNTRLTIMSDSIPIYTIEIVSAYDHDETAFTQGLIFKDGFLYESTGLNGASTLRKVVPETGEVTQSIDIADEYFGEGITIWNNTIFQLTWLSKKGFAYDIDTFNVIEEFSLIPDEGWGLTHDFNYLIMSDGTSNLYYLDPFSKDIISILPVSDNGSAITRLNELEYIHGDVFANIWLSSNIARISTVDGKINGWIDCSKISDVQPNGVLNGIAYKEESNTLYLTGKNWTRVYEVQIVPTKLKSLNDSFFLNF